MTIFNGRREHRKMGKCSGAVLRVVVGHLIHTFGLFPPALSVLQHTFRFIVEHLGEVTVLPMVVKRELAASRGLLFACQVQLQKPMASAIYCSDSSMQ
eukprot:6291522-Amphidinium_carterae.1